MSESAKKSSNGGAKNDPLAQAMMVLLEEAVENIKRPQEKHLDLSIKAAHTSEKTTVEFSNDLVTGVCKMGSKLLKLLK